MQRLLGVLLAWPTDSDHMCNCIGRALLDFCRDKVDKVYLAINLTSPIMPLHLAELSLGQHSVIVLGVVSLMLFAILKRVIFDFVLCYTLQNPF